MNFDSNYRFQTVRNHKEKSLIDNIRKLPVVQKVYLYVFLMATVGMAMGEMKHRVEAKNCWTKDSCWTVEPSQRRIKELGAGAIAGIGTAVLISIPALLKEN